MDDIQLHKDNAINTAKIIDMDKRLEKVETTVGETHDAVLIMSTQLTTYFKDDKEFKDKYYENKEKQDKRLTENEVNIIWIKRIGIPSFVFLIGRILYSLVM